MKDWAIGRQCEFQPFAEELLMVFTIYQCLGFQVRIAPCGEQPSCPESGLRSIKLVKHEMLLVKSTGLASHLGRDEQRYVA